jgi:hypothetical protein
LPDPELVFESALLATKAEQYADAIKKFRIFLSFSATGSDPSRTFSIQAEIDRLMSILDGQDPVTWVSLADEVYEVRKSAFVTAGSAAGSPTNAKDSSGQKKSGTPSWETDNNWISQAELDKTIKSSESKPKEPVAPVTPMAQQTQEAPKLSLEELLFYVKSRSSAIRMKALKDLTTMSDDRARVALEDRLVRDPNIQIRIAAIAGLEARRSVHSIPVIWRAVITASSSSERARLKKAIKTILGVSSAIR